MPVGHAHNAEHNRGRHELEGVTVRHLRAALGFAAAAVLSAAPAYADPAADPHMPNMQAGYCPGGGRVWPKTGFWSASERSKNMTLKGQKILQN